MHKPIPTRNDPWVRWARILLVLVVAAVSLALASPADAQILPTAPTPTIPGGGIMSPTIPGAAVRTGRMEYPFFTVTALSCDPVPGKLGRAPCVFPVFGFPSDAASCAKTTAKMLPQVKLDYARMNIQLIMAECLPYKP